MIDSFEFENSLFPAEGLGLNPHTKAKISRCEKTNISADFSTSVFEGMPGICLPKP